MMTLLLAQVDEHLDLRQYDRLPFLPQCHSYLGRLCIGTMGVVSFMLLISINGYEHGLKESKKVYQEKDMESFNGSENEAEIYFIYSPALYSILKTRHCVSLTFT